MSSSSDAGGIGQPGKTSASLPHLTAKPVLSQAAPMAAATALTPTMTPAASQITAVTAGLAIPPVAPGQMCPNVLKERLLELEDWVQANEKDSNRYEKMIWALKIPLICITASTSVFAGFGWKSAGIVAGAVAAALVSLESKNPYAVRQIKCETAVHELRLLETKLQNRWQNGLLKGKDPKELAAEIIAFVEKEELRIGEYLKPSHAKRRNARS